MVRAFALGRVNRTIKKFCRLKKPIGDKGQRLLKGFYTANKWELEERSDDDGGDFGANLDYGRSSNILQNFHIAKRWRTQKSTKDKDR